MAAPLITFKAGQCEYDGDTGSTVRPDATPGYIYITQEDDLHHFCWRPRSALHTNPSLDLLMFPTDATFKPYRPANVKTAIAGRIYVLKFSSSSGRHFFWLQSSGKTSDPSEFSARDLKIGEIVNSILQGEEVDVSRELRNIPKGGNGGDSDEEDEDEDDDDDEDTAMEDADGSGSGGNLRRAASGGAGAGATGGDIREEGEGAREGGADGGRAPPSTTNTSSATPADPTQAAITNFLRSLQGSNLANTSTTSQPQEQTFTTLPDLLSTSTTLSTLSTLPSSTLDTLLSHLPPQITLLSSGLSPAEISSSDLTDTETLSAITLSLPTDQKRTILAKILRSPQLQQALASLTHAIRDGGLPGIAEALKIPVANGGLVPNANVPLGGGSAVKTFLQGVKKGVEEAGDGEDEEEDTQMQE